MHGHNLTSANANHIAVALVAILDNREYVRLHNICADNHRTRAILFECIQTRLETVCLLETQLR